MTTIGRFFESTDPNDPGEVQVWYEASQSSHQQINEFIELRFDAEFFKQGRRKGKSSSKLQISREFLLSLHNSFEPLADLADLAEDVAIGQDEEEIPPQRK